MKYYENIRLVVEIESKVQEIKKVTRPAGTKEEQRAGEESQEQHEWRTRAQTGEKLQPR